VSDVIKDFREVDQLVSQRQAADGTEFEKNSLKSDTALETQHLRDDEAASLENLE